MKNGWSLLWERIDYQSNRFLTFVEELAFSKKYSDHRVITGSLIGFLVIGMILGFLALEGIWYRSTTTTSFYLNQEVVVSKEGCADITIKVISYRPPASRGSMTSDTGSYIFVVDNVVYERAAQAKLETQHCFYGRFEQAWIDASGNQLVVIRHQPDVQLIVKGAGGFTPPPRQTSLLN